GADAWVVRDGQTHELRDGGLRPAGTLPIGRLFVQGGKLVSDEIVRARRAAGRGGVVAIAGDRVTLSGITGVGPDEIRAAFAAAGEVGVRRLVRRRTGHRPLVVIQP